MKRFIIGLLPVCFAVACSNERPPAESPASSDAQYTGSSSSASAADSADSSSTTVRASDPDADAHSSHAGHADKAAPRDGEGTSDTASMERRDPPATGVAPDNTKVNERDRDAASVTPTDQGENRSDLDITQRIRQAVMADDSLSFTAKNAKIITENGRVTLRGVVKTAQERTAIAAAANKVAGAANVVNQIEVK